MLNAAETYSKMFTAWLIDNNYDGVMDLMGHIRQYVAIYPTQIKSINNDGSWDINDNNFYS